MESSKIYNKIDILIVLYGIDASGKTTQARKVKKILLDQGYDVEHIRTPSESVFGRVQRGILRNNGSKKKAAIFGFLDFLTVIPKLKVAKKYDRKIKKISPKELNEGDIDKLEKKLEEAVDYTGKIYLMERHILFDAVGYFPEMINKRIYKFFSKWLHKPGFAVRLKAFPIEAYERALERGEKLEVTETLESLIKADRNFDMISLEGIEIKTVYSGDSILPEAVADEIVEYIKDFKRINETKIIYGMEKVKRKMIKSLRTVGKYTKRESNNQ